MMQRGDRLIQRAEQRLHRWEQGRCPARRPRVKDDALDMHRRVAEPDRVLQEERGDGLLGRKDVPLRIGAARGDE